MGKGFEFPGAFEKTWTSAEKENLINELFQNYQRPPAPSPTASIVIPVHNQIEHTVRCLLSIARSNNHISYEIIVIDDASTDDTPSVLEKVTGIHYIRNTQNQGFLASCNKAAANAKGEYFVFLNNDTRVHERWLDYLHKTFMDIPNAGLVGSKLILPYGRLQEAGGTIWSDGSAMNYGRGGDPRHYHYNYVCDVDYVSGASIMLPRALWQKLGGFDSTYQPAYYEDVDLAFRIRKSGYRVLYQPFSQVTHLEGGSHGIDLNNGIKRFQVINQDKFFKTWQETIANYKLRAEAPEYLQRHRLRKGTVLYIDDYTPMPDRHAGGVLSEFYLTALREAGYDVTFLPHVDLRYMDTHTSVLQRKGIECVYLPYATSSGQFIKQNGRQFDYVFLSRAPVASETIDLVKKFAPQAKIIFNTIDLRFLRLKRAAERTGSKSDTEIARQAKETELEIVEKSDCTLVVSTAEKELLDKVSPRSRVTVVPFPAEIHDIKNGFNERRDIVFVGSFRHDPNIDAVLFFINEVWPLITKKLPNVRFVVAGPEPPSQIKRLNSDTVSVKGYVDDLASIFETAMVSVAPLRYGAGIKGKVLTSLGYGVPCIASSIASEGMRLTHNTNILIANTPEEIANAAAGIFASQDVWKSLSQKGQEWVRAHYSKPVVASQLLEIFNDL